VRTLLIAPGEGADDLVASLAELEDTEIVRADPVAGGDDPAAIAAAIAGYEAQGQSIGPAAAIVHGSGDRPLAAAISLVKLEIPVARVSGPDGDGDLTGLVAGHTVQAGGSLAEQVSAWLRRILTT
jgi:hypothetical protein